MDLIKEWVKFPKPEDLTEVLGILLYYLEPNIKAWGDVQQIPREFLEKKAQEFANTQK